MSRNRMLTGLVALMAALLLSMFLGLAAYAQEEDEEDETEEVAEDEDEDEEDEDEDEEDEGDGGDDGPPSEDDEREADEDEAMEEDFEEEECTPADYEELKLLADLRKRDNALQKQAKLLEEKEAVLGRVQDELNKKMAAMMAKLETLENRLELGQAQRDAREQRLQKLVETLKTLSARKAAPILEKADSRFATRLLLGLGPERTGKLLAAMEPARAARLMVRLERAQTPGQKAARAANAGK